MTVFFTADHHFGHGHPDILRERGCLTPQEMDAKMIESWNARVQPRDIVYHLGDFTLENPIQACYILRQLQGRIRLVPSIDHDRKWLDGPFDFQEPYIGKPGWPEHVEVLSPITVIKVPKIETGTGKKRNEVFCLCHYPMRTWSRSHYGSWHLHGHSHGGFGILTSPKSIDVGVDNCYDLAPVSAARIGMVMLGGIEIGPELKL